MTAAPQRCSLMSTGHHEAALAAAGERPRRAGTRHRATTRSWRRRAERGEARLALLRRRPVAVPTTSVRRPAGTLEPTCTWLTALAAATEPDRPDRDRVDDLQRAVQPGPAVRVARPLSGGRAGWNIVTTAGAEAAQQLRPGRAARPTRERYERADRVPRGRRQAVGQLGGRRVRRRQGERASGPTPTGSTRSSTSASTSGCPGRSTPRAPRRATRCSCRPARPRTARTSPPGTPRPSSPRTRRSASAQAFYADLKARAARLGRDPEQLQDPARHQSRSSGPPRPEAQALRGRAGPS